MDELVIAGRKFQSRLLVGTGKFSSNQAMLEAMEASGSDIVTVALRRVDIDNPADYMLKHIDRHKYLLLPNTSGARDSEEAVRLARLARAAGCEPWIKLEVTPDHTVRVGGHVNGVAKGVMTLSDSAGHLAGQLIDEDALREAE